MRPLLDHKLTAHVSDEGYAIITGRIVSFGESIDYGKFTEVIAYDAYDKTDLAHVVASVVYEGKRSVVAHVYTNDLTLTISPDGLYFKLEVYMNLDFLVDSLAKVDLQQYTGDFFRQPSERCKNKIPVERGCGSSSLNVSADDCTSLRYIQKWPTGQRPASQSQHDSPVRF